MVETNGGISRLRNVRTQMNELTARASGNDSWKAISEIAERVKNKLPDIEEALINTKPQLEIYADDVKCTHGATIGQLDQDALFYLRSRGIDKATAHSLLIYAFASEVVNRIKVESVRVELDNYLFSWLPKGHLVKEAM